MGFLHRISHLTPGYLACAGCRKLYPIDPNDTLDNPMYPRRGCLDARSCYCVRNQSRARLEYVLVRNHIQLAPKYTRLGTQTEYLDKLMKLHPRREYRQWHRETTMDTWTTETPKVVDRRFLNETIWKLRRRGGPEIRPSDTNSALPKICMSCSLYLALKFVHRLQDRGLRHQSGLLYNYLSHVEAPVPTRRQSCKDCRAEFEFQLDDKTWLVRSWRDFGTKKETALTMGPD